MEKFRDLYDKSPQELKAIVMSQWKAKQNPKHHPEGNTLKHIITVTNRAFHYFPDSPDIQLAAYFHDLGKLATAGVNPKTGQPTAYGHEGEGVGLVDKYKNFIEDQGADPEIVRYIVKNHMKIKPSTWDVMKQKKKDPIMNDPSFDKLMKFGDIDKGGLNLQERIRKLVRSILNENTADRFAEDLDNIDRFLGDRNNAEYDWREEETYMHSASWKEQGSNLELNTDFDKFYDELETNGPQKSGNVTFKAGPKDVYGKKITYTVNESKKLNENMKPSKEILRMKKLAGLITESEIKQILKEETIEGQDAVGAFMDAKKLTVDGEPLSDDIVSKLNDYISDLRTYRDTGSGEPDFGEIDEFVQQYAGKDITDEDGDKLEFTEKDVEDYTEAFDEGGGYERMNQSDLSFGFE